MHKSRQPMPKAPHMLIFFLATRSAHPPADLSSHIARSLDRLLRSAWSRDRHITRRMPPLSRHCRFVTSCAVASTPWPDGSGVLPDAVVAELVDALA